MDSSTPTSHHIIEAIDGCRKRKARPDIERILKWIRRKYSFDEGDILKALNASVEDGSVIKVRYKDSISYRNPAKFTRNSAHNYVATIRQHQAIIARSKAAQETKVGSHGASDANGSASCRPSPLISGETPATGSSATIPSNRGPSSAVTSKSFPPNGGLSSNLTNRSFSSNRGPSGSSGTMMNSSSSSSTSSNHTSHGGHANAKMTSSGVNVARANVGRTVAAKCSQCNQTESSNQLGKAEKFLECKDCDYKAHPSCMRYPPQLVYRCRQSPWQCVFCKDCCKCEGSGQVESILLCDLCDKGYHMECHDPPLRSKPPGSWVCSDCQASVNRDATLKARGTLKTHETESDAGFDETSASSGGGYEEEVDEDNISDGESGESSSISEEAISPIKRSDAVSREGLDKIFLNMQPSLDDIALEFPAIRNKPVHWTPRDVECFIRVIGFPEQAASFREQEIDGISLLLLKRADILTGMSLKLGPALKIYGQIQRLQTIHNQ